jgi:hypothetical protein
MIDKTTKTILIAIAVGLWLNAAVMLFRPTPVHAQPGFARVQKANIGSNANIVGSEVLGFSCATVKGEPQCFFAVR